MKEELLELKKLLKEEEIYNKRVSEAKKKHNEELSLIAKASDMDNIKSKIATLKETIQKQALEDHAKTGEKFLLGGVGIQDRSTMTYDEKKAFEWAKEKQLCLTLDKKSFEKLAKTQDFDFVTMGSEKKVTFPKTIKIQG